MKYYPQKWKAKWVVNPTKSKKPKQGSPATYFRKSFTLGKEVSAAYIYATCHGVYHLTVNGKRVDDREFAPEFTVYEKMLYVQEYDISSLVKRGENVICVTVGDGWYNGGTTKQTYPGWDPRHACLWQMEINNADGSTETICSDENIHASAGPIISSDLFKGETLDTNVEYAWRPAVIADFGYKNLVPQNDEPVRPVMTLPVKEVLHTPNGETLLDFGQTIAGRLRVHVDLPKDSSVTFEHSETLDNKGNYFNNIQGINQQDKFISNGTAALFEPAFTFHGFRYVRVSGIRNIRKEDFTAVVLSTDAEWIGSFECSDKKINRLVENTIWSQRANMLSVPTDCPQREKMGWTGDMTVYSKTALMNQNLTGLFTRWLYSLSFSQHLDGQVPNVVPLPDFYKMVSKLTNVLLGGSFKDVASSGWGDAAVAVPWALYEATGNKAILEQQYGSMKAWVEYMRKQAATRKPKKDVQPLEIEQYLWDTGFHFGEWLIPSATERGSMSAAVRKSAKLGRRYIAPVFFYMSSKTLAKTAALLGKDEDSKVYMNLADNIKNAYRNSMVNPDGTLKVDVQGAYALALGAGLIPDDLKQRAALRLVSLIHSNGDRLDTGFLATPYLLDALSENGHIDLAYILLYQNQRPGWMYEVEQGATTIWENWNNKNEKGEPLQTSLNHYAFGCVADWIYRKIGGITNIGIGYDRILVQPQPDKRLSWGKRSYRSSHGEIVCDWKLEKENFYLHVIIPRGTDATVVLPDGTRYEVTEGTYDYKCRATQYEN